MKLSYDRATDSLYIHLSERVSTDSDEVVDGVVLDYAEDGSLVGIDVQHASRKADIHHLAVSLLPLTELEAACPRDSQFDQYARMRRIARQFPWR